MAQFVGASSSEDLVFVENASDACNCAINSIKWEEGDKILITNISYSMVKKTVDYMCKRYKINKLIVQFDDNSL